MAGLVVASNRGPVNWRRTSDGELEARRGFGGLVTALGGALQHERGTWISVALSEGDAEVSARHGGAPFEVRAEGSTYTVQLLDEGQRFERYYNEVSNRLLWFTVHALWNRPYQPEGVAWRQDWYEGYVPVNDDVARAVADAAGDEIHIHDYHLALVPRHVRAARPDAALLHYLHTPWVGPEVLGVLPDELVRAVLRGMLAADVIGLSSPAWCDAFRRCCAHFLGAHVADGDVDYDGRRTAVVDFVLGVDAQELTATAASDDVVAAGQTLDAQRDGRALIVRVDRSDLSKNILRGLHAYELLLERHPALRGRVWHFAHINPSRQGVREYRDYLAACQDAAERIQTRFGEDTLTFTVADNYPMALAALQRYDVLLASPIMDGTNLVAKEGPVLNTRDGQVVLSARAGAATVLADAALLVNPYDVDQQADALYTALTMTSDERSARSRRLREAACVSPPETWFARQREVLRAATSG